MNGLESMDWEQNWTLIDDNWHELFIDSLSIDVGPVSYEIRLELWVHEVWLNREIIFMKKIMINQNQGHWKRLSFRRKKRGKTQLVSRREKRGKKLSWIQKKVAQAIAKLCLKILFVFSIIYSHYHSWHSLSAFKHQNLK